MDLYAFNKSIKVYDHEAMDSAGNYFMVVELVERRKKTRKRGGEKEKKRVGLEDSTDGTVGLGWGAVEAGAATEESTDMDVDAAREAGAEGSTDTAAGSAGVDVVATGGGAGKKKKRRKNSKRKRGGSAQAGRNERQRRPQLTDTLEGELRESP